MVEATPLDVPADLKWTANGNGVGVSSLEPDNDQIHASVITSPNSVLNRPVSLALTAAETASPVPLVVTGSVLDDLALNVNDQVLVNVQNTLVPAYIVQRVPMVTGDAIGHQTIVANISTLELAAIQQGGRSVAPSEWWMAVADQDVDAYATTLPPDATVTSRVGLAEDLKNDPLRVAIQAALWLVTGAAVVLAALGFAVHAIVTVRAREIELAQMRAIGVMRGQLLRIVSSENGLLSILGLVFRAWPRHRTELLGCTPRVRWRGRQAADSTGDCGDSVGRSRRAGRRGGRGARGVHRHREFHAASHQAGPNAADGGRAMSEPTTIDVSPPASGPSANNGTFGAMWLLVRRRLWRDRWLVVSSALVVALATLLALSGPELVARTIDDGAADAVTAAGPNADITVTVPVGNPNGDNVSSIKGLPVEEFATLGETIVSNLPPRTQSVVEGYDSWVLSNGAPLGWSASAAAVAKQEADGGELAKVPRVGDFFQFGYSEQAETTLVEGALPEDPPNPEDTTGVGAVVPPTQVAISQEVADALELAIGDHVQVTTSAGESLILEVSGIVEAKDPSAPIWERYPEFTAPLIAKGGAGPNLRRGTIIVSQATFEGITASLRTPFPGYVRISVDPSKMTLNLAKVDFRRTEGLADQPQGTRGRTQGRQRHRHHWSRRSPGAVPAARACRARPDVDHHRGSGVRGRGRHRAHGLAATHSSRERHLA